MEVSVIQWALEDNLTRIRWRERNQHSPAIVLRHTCPNTIYFSRILARRSDLRPLKCFTIEAALPGFARSTMMNRIIRPSAGAYRRLEKGYSHSLEEATKFGVFQHCQTS